MPFVSILFRDSKRPKRISFQEQVRRNSKDSKRHFLAPVHDDIIMIVAIDF